MPQFTFACFCGLHGLCRRRKKKKKKQEEQQQDYETVVWRFGTENTLGSMPKKVFVSPQQTSGLILRDYFPKFLQELYSVKESETKAKHSYILDHVHELWVGVSVSVWFHRLDWLLQIIYSAYLQLLWHRKELQTKISYSNWTKRTEDVVSPQTPPPPPPY